MTSHGLKQYYLSLIAVDTHVLDVKNEGNVRYQSTKVIKSGRIFSCFQSAPVTPGAILDRTGKEKETLSVF